MLRHSPFLSGVIDERIETVRSQPETVAELLAGHPASQWVPAVILIECVHGLILQGISMGHRYEQWRVAFSQTDQLAGSC